MKIRVHELAKKYGFENSKEFLEVLKENVGLKISSHLAGVTPEQANAIKEYFSDKKSSEKVNEENMNDNKHKSNTGREEVKETLKEVKKEVAVKEETVAPSKKSKTKKNDSENDFRNKKKKKGRRTDFVVKKVEQGPEVVEEDGMKIIKIRGEITLGDFANRLKVGSSELIKKLFLKGQMLTINSPISLELAEELAMDYNALVEEEEEIALDFGDKFALAQWPEVPTCARIHIQALK